MLLQKQYRDYCLGHVWDAEQKKDIWQEVMLALVVWVNRPDFQLHDQTKLATWLYATTRNIIQRMYRDGLIHEKHIARYQDEIDTIDQQSSTDFLHHREIYAIFQQLPLDDQQLLEQYELRGSQRVEDVAQQLGLTKNALVMRVERIKHRFFSLCQQHGLL